MSARENAGQFTARGKERAAVLAHEARNRFDNRRSRGEIPVVKSVPLQAARAELTELGPHIIADPRVCGGMPVFRGSRVMVWQVLDQVAAGMPWEQICWSWRGRVTHEAIAEAIQLAAGQFRGPALERVPSRRERVRSRSLAPA